MLRALSEVNDGRSTLESWFTHHRRLCPYTSIDREKLQCKCTLTGVGQPAVATGGELLR